MIRTGICRIVIAAVWILPLHVLGQKVDLPRELWVNCDPPLGKNAVVVGPTVTTKNVRHEINSYRLVDDQKGRDCEVQFDLLGFTLDDWVALRTRISTFYDVDEDETTKPKNLKCSESTQWVAINPLTEARRSIPS